MNPPPPAAEPQKPALPSKTAQAPKSAPPPKSKPAPPKKRRSYWRLWLFLLVAAAVAITVYYPRQVERWTGWELPAFVLEMRERFLPPSEKAETMESLEIPETAEAMKPAEIPEMAKEAAAVETPEWAKEVETPETPKIEETTAKTEEPPLFIQPAIQPAASDDDDDDITRRLQSAERAAKAAQRTADSAARLARRLEKELEESTRVDSGDGDALQLQVIDLALQLNGDTAAAATALRRLAAGSAAPKLLAEAARLQATPPRAELLRELRALDGQAEEQPAPAAGGDDLKSQLAEIFNVRRTAAARQEGGLSWRLEMLLLTGQDAAYWALLQQTLAGGGAAAAPRAGLEKLARYGAPNYRLQLP